MTLTGQASELAARLLRMGFSAQQQGQLAQARHLYLQVLGLDPRNFDALQLLGLCCLQSGELQSARQYLDRALSLRQDVATVFNHRGVVLRRLGEFAAAQDDFSRVIAIGARPAEGHYNRANTLRDMGRLGEALNDYRRATELEPSRPEFLNNLGACLKDLEFHDEALRCYERLIALTPGNAEAHSNRGLVLQKLGRLDEALASEDRALALAPDHAAAWSNRGGILLALARPADALASLDKALALEPQQPDVLAQRGMTLTELGRAAEAEQDFETALRLKPGLSKARLALGKLAAEQGRFSEAESLLLAVHQAEPRNVTCLYWLADVRKYEAGDPLFASFETLLEDGTLSNDERATLHHGYAKVLNDVGRADGAMDHFARSKALRPATFDLGRHRASYAALQQAFTRQFFAERGSLGSGDDRPVFIIGMPRSGTTLTEQILAAHPEAMGLGELQDMPRVSRLLEGGLGNIDRFLAACTSLDSGRAAELAASYSAAFAGCDPAIRRLVDKRPHNFELLGLIALLFPRAHVIHCRRDPMDTCISMYMQDFSEGHGYNRDLATLGHYYRCYADLMAHWEAVLPLPIHPFVYEDTVADLEGSARALVEFVGLGWDARCLAFHDQEHQVRTPSQWQVRQPVYRSSVERWRRYEKHLGPLKEALGIG